ncbi:ABC transporter permease [Streptomyces sp. 4N509B]|uniref:ABC transporter permease n=1 Tax=Streptomyces sp. 4N509B TaxID=3457413 RepID=UPI003FD6B4F6
MSTAAGVFTNTVFGFIVAYAFIALWETRPHLGGYDEAQALTFVWTTQALIACVAVFSTGFNHEMQERIHNGDIAIDLYRPVDLQLWYLASDLGRAAFHLLGRGIVPLTVGALAFDLALPRHPLVWLAFLASVTLAVVVSFALRYMVALAAFWLIDASGVNMISALLSMFGSGMLVPLTLFPGAFGEVVRLLPWASILQVPADVLLGRHAGPVGVAGALAFQAAWALVLLAAGRALQAAATRKVVVQGG